MSRLQPDVLLTDLQLPDGQGVELVNDLESKETTEVVLITGHASVESAVQALRPGATDYTGKPHDINRPRSILRPDAGLHIGNGCAEAPDVDAGYKGKPVGGD